MKLIFISSSFCIIWYMRQHRIVAQTYDRDQDTFRVQFLLLPSFLLSLAINQQFTAVEVLWTFSIYLEAVAILPQLVLLQRTYNVDTLTSNYVFLLGAYRTLYIFNWLYRFFTEPGYSQWIVWLSGTLQTAIYCDFFYYYLVSWRRNERLSLPSWSSDECNSESQRIYCWTVNISLVCSNNWINWNVLNKINSFFCWPPHRGVKSVIFARKVISCHLDQILVLWEKSTHASAHVKGTIVLCILEILVRSTALEFSPTRCFPTFSSRAPRYDGRAIVYDAFVSSKLCEQPSATRGYEYSFNSTGFNSNSSSANGRVGD